MNQKTTERIHNRILEWLFQTLKNEISFNNFEEREQYKCQFFYEDYRIIIDGSEQEVPRPQNPFKDFEFYSTKKSQHSINKLIIIDLNKTILYLSPSYPGIITDIVAARSCLNEWKIAFENDEMLADQGFEGLEENGIRILTSEKNTAFGRIFSSYRIRVENVLEQIKNWRICSDKLRIKMVDKEKILSFHHKAWTIVSVFVNKFK